MSEDQHLPVKFHAAVALDNILTNEAAIQFIRPGLDQVVKCYLSLMHELDNEDIVEAF